MNKMKMKIAVTALIVLRAALSISLTLLALNESATDPELEMFANNISFSDTLFIKYAISMNNIHDYSNVRLLIWTEAQNDYLLGTEHCSIKYSGFSTVAEKECLIFDYKDISAKEMTDVVYARAAYEKGGKVYYSDVNKYSVLTYAYNKLGYTGTATQNEDLAALLEGLLEYGASAQN